MLSPVCVIGLARSGTTLVQALLNSISGVRIHGENHVVLQMANSIGALQNRLHIILAKGDVTELPISHPFFGLEKVDFESFLVSQREIITKHFLPNADQFKVIGFKEVRWAKGNFAFDGMSQLFPNAKYIFNFRNEDDIFKSHSRKQWGATMFEITKQQEFLKAKAEEKGKSAISIHYEDYTRDIHKFNEVTKFLGIKADPEALARTLAIRLIH